MHVSLSKAALFGEVSRLGGDKQTVFYLPRLTLLTIHRPRRKTKAKGVKMQAYKGNMIWAQRVIDLYVPSVAAELTSARPARF